MKTIKYTCNLLLAVVAGLMLVGLVLAWKLSQGPISLPQLTPHIVEAVSQNTRGMSVRIKDTTLSWQGWERNLDFRISGMEVFTQDGRRLAFIPEAALSLSASALFEGVVAPSSLELVKPVIHLLRDKDGHFAFDMGGETTVRADEAFRIDNFISLTPSPERPLSYLQEVIIQEAEFDYEDLQSGQRFQAPSTSVALKRVGEKLILQTALNVAFNDQPAEVGFRGEYNLSTEIFDTFTDIKSLNISDLQQFMPRYNELLAFDFDLEGQIRLSFNVDHEVRSFSATLKARDGQLHLPEPAPQTLNLDVMSIAASYDNLDGILNVSEAFLALHQDSVVKLPEPLLHDMPFESVRLKGAYDRNSDQANIENLRIDLGEGPIGTLKGSIEGLLNGDTRKADFIGEVTKVEVSKLKRYWPGQLNDDAHEWVTTNLSDGIVHRAGIDLSLSMFADGEVELHHVRGDMEMEGVSVQYLKPMPRVRNAGGWAKFDHQNFNITITQGNVGDIKVTGGQLDITGLDEYDQTLHVDLDTAGPLKDTLIFIDNEPLGFASALNLDATKAAGYAETNLKMKFQLLDDLLLDDVEVSAQSKAKGVEIQDVMFEEDLRNGNITLRVDKKGMDVEGDIVLGTIPAQLKWRENFTTDTLYKRRFVLDGTVTPQQRVKELRLDFPPFNNQVIDGDMQVDATITSDWNGLGTIEAFADLKGADIKIPVLYWEKETEAAGEAYAKVIFDADRLISVPYFSIKSQDLEASGSINLDQRGEDLQTLRIKRFRAGRTDLTGGTILKSPVSGWEVDVHGNSLDLSPLITDRRSTDDGSVTVNRDTELPGAFSGRFNKIWLDDEHSLNTVAGAVTSDGKIWTQAHLTGVVVGGKPFMIDISPEKENRRVTMATDDAGALLRALDLFDDMQGGVLNIDGVLNDTVEGRPLVGTIQVDDYRIVEVPALAKLLSLVALTGVLDSLQGEGIGFTSLNAPFKFDNGVIEFKDGRTNGISIGLTWEGKIYTHADVADIQGTIVPMYGLNTILGNVPLLGQLFTAGEKGGGLFAWTYDVVGELSDPDVSINPISALAPGVLRRLFQNNQSAEVEGSEPVVN